MKIVNKTNTGLSFSFSYGKVSGCGFVGPGGKVERDFPQQAQVWISTFDSMVYSDVTTETISVASSIS
jgi:hypothetical protein